MCVEYFEEKYFCYSNRNCTLTLFGAHTRRGRFCLYKINIIGLVIGYLRFKGRDGGAESFNIKRDIKKMKGNPIRMTEINVQ